MNPDLSCLEIHKEVGTFVLFPYRQFVTLENDGAVFVRCFVQVVYSGGLVEFAQGSFSDESKQKADCTRKKGDIKGCHEKSSPVKNDLVVLDPMEPYQTFLPGTVRKGGRTTRRPRR